ncbi:hypothetical protein IQ230_10340 [Gloeocapsopsis crepidinum LEGE 06123]|uniref:Uncharacterized protein n=1 Tax=Gloeocapsopsis crepidinum LEGE 06123 TaxID=588587 RepID=A0ABR9URP9_9CHRO|nr:hypothetical protein [Gloeocapsopsis crepidinum]MBE9190745.1 hypothetical protein [Gloeocapsopsis crepidinum LEGE 06123]
MGEIFRAGYQPQSRDTHPEVDKFLMRAFRNMPVWKKAHLVDEATKGIQQWALIGIRNQFPDISQTETKFQLAVRWLGIDLANRFYKNNQEKIVDAESIQLALKIAAIFDKLAIPYLIGGSVASSILGEPRATLDVDFVADLQLSHVSPLLVAMGKDFFIDEGMVTEAIERQSSFNVIHLESMQKADIFLLSNQPLAQSEMQRRQQLIITQNPERQAWLPSAEDIILQKLIWYRMGGGVSDRQWRDVLGVLKVQADKIDINYLTQWAETLNLIEMLTQALQQAGVAN